MHEGRVSSHFLRRARQVQHPVLERVTPDLDGGDLACGGDMCCTSWYRNAAGVGRHGLAIFAHARGGNRLPEIVGSIVQDCGMVVDDYSRILLLIFG